MINTLADSSKVILTVFASPYSIGQLADPKKFESIIVGYQDEKLANEIAPQGLFPYFMDKLNAIRTYLAMKFLSINI